MVLFIALAGAEVSPAQGDSAEALGSSRAGSAQGWEMHQCLLPTPHHPAPPILPKVLWVALFASLVRGNTCGGVSALIRVSVLRGCQELSTSPFPPLVPSQGCRSQGHWWPVTVGDAWGRAGDKG